MEIVQWGVRYGVVGCVEITTQGNNLGWSDAAMFNLDKTLELTLNNGKSLLSGDKIGPDLGNLTDYETFEELEEAFAKSITYFMDKMILACEEVEKAHMDILPSPFLSSIIDNCIEKGIDVTKGGAVYNFSGIQMIQIANLADGGMSPVYGRDIAGPTAVLKSVSSLDNYLTTNGGLLNMKFLPESFKTESNIDKFAKFLRTFVDLKAFTKDFEKLCGEGKTMLDC